MTIANLRVLSLNTWKCDGDYSKRLPLMISASKAVKPDIVLLQEDFSTLDLAQHTSRAIARELALNLEFYLARLKPRVFEGRTIKSYSGLAILSKFPIKETSVIPFPKTKGDEDRMAFLAKIKLGSEDLVICNLHLTHLQTSDQPQLHQLKYLLEHLENNFSGETVIIGGDFNSDPKSKAMKWFMSQRDFPIDVESLNACNLDQPTLIQKPERVDYIFTHSNKVHFFDLAEHIVFNQISNDLPLYPSDHAGVILDMKYNFDL